MKQIIKPSYIIKMMKIYNKIRLSLDKFMEIVGYNWVGYKVDIKALEKDIKALEKDVTLLMNIINNDDDERI